MTPTESIVNVGIRFLFRLIFRMETSEITRVPTRGPAILMTNHTSNLEGPAYYVFLQPSRLTAIGKIELWRNPLTRFLMNLWNVIPVRRGQVDRTAIRETVARLKEGYVVGIAPEGTRNKHGVMRRAHPGVALIATRLEVPVYPVVHWGFTDFRKQLARLRRARVVFRVGEPFYVAGKPGQRFSADELRDITDQMMYRLAELLPPEMRGYYADLTKKTDGMLKPYSADRTDRRHLPSGS